MTTRRTYSLSVRSSRAAQRDRSSISRSVRWMRNDSEHFSTMAMNQTPQEWAAAKVKALIAQLETLAFMGFTIP